MSSRLLICGFGPFPAAPQNPAAAVVERLQAAAWAPPGVSAVYAVLPTVWDSAPALAAEAAKAAEADAVLLIGVAASAQAFRIETLARNYACSTPDAAGLGGPGGAIASGAADLAVPVAAQALARAVLACGLPVELSDHAGDYLCNFTLYRLLAEGWRTAFLHVPMARECDPAGRFGLDDIEAAVRATATTLPLKR